MGCQPEPVDCRHSMSLPQFRRFSHSGLESTRGEGHFWRVTPQQALCDCFFFQAEQWGEFRNAACNAIDCVNRIVGSVALLLGWCCPAAIAGFVALAPVDTVNPQPRPRISHVSKEILKYQPAFAHSNPLSAIILETDVFRVNAPLNDALPEIVNTGASHPVLKGWVVFSSTFPQVLVTIDSRHTVVCSTALFSSGQARQQPTCQSDSEGETPA